MILQVWYTAIMVDGTQRHAIVAAKSRRAAAALLDVSDRFLKEYGSQTGNEEQVKLATSQPGVVFVTKNTNWPQIYKPLVRKVRP